MFLKGWLSIQILWFRRGNRVALVSE